MTMKRFTITQDFEEHHRQIRDNGKIIMGCFLEAQAEPIVKLLNELHEENQNLQGKASTWKITASEEIVEKEALMKQIVELKQKNRQLNSENKMLKNTIARNESYIEKLTHKGEWSN